MTSEALCDGLNIKRARRVRISGTEGGEERQATTATSHRAYAINSASARLKGTSSFETGGPSSSSA